MVIGFNFGRPVNVAVTVVEELLSLQELLHVDQLVDYVEVYVYQVAILQIVGADYEMPVCITDPHVASHPSELDLEVAERILRFFA